MASEKQRPEYRILSQRTIALAALALIVIGVGVAASLLFAYADGTTQARNQLDAIKTAGTIVVGTGGAGALWLAARRQRTSEIALRQKDIDQARADQEFALQQQVAQATEADAAERRVTELYTMAADQLGSDKAPVRLAGLYALERLAQGTTSQRQTIVNLICAYLRMPQETGATIGDAQEREIRLTALEIVTKHLHEGSVGYWPGIDLHLDNAVLLDPDLSGCTVRTLHCANARITGNADFGGLHVTERAVWRSSRFTGDVDFSNTVFDAPTVFAGARFTGRAGFAAASFRDDVDLRHVTFEASSTFAGARFGGIVELARAQCIGDIRFSETVFTGRTSFDRTEFRGVGRFMSVTFEDEVRFDDARFHTLAEFDDVRFNRPVEFSQARFEGDTRFMRVAFADSARFGSAHFTGDARFSGALVRLDVPETVVRVWPSIDLARPGRFEVVPADDLPRSWFADATGQWGVVQYVSDDDGNAT